MMPRYLFVKKIGIWGHDEICLIVSGCHVEFLYSEIDSCMFLCVVPHYIHKYEISHSNYVFWIDDD